jgi:predicted nucleotide-binding protein (sugar kinase/HSP70/actin superfamily)
MNELGRKALEQAVADGTPAVLLAGHSYNAFSPEASQSVGKKLASMGIVAIPADCLVPVEDGPTVWHYANQILNAATLAKEHPNLFLLCISNFSCTVDAFTHSRLTSQMGAKPYLILEIDAHTADAGVQTRLEAFLDIVRNYREGKGERPTSFSPCRLGKHGRVIRSNGEEVSIKDPRVKLYFPNFSPYHTQALAMSTQWLGLHPGPVIPLERSQLDRGLQYTSGRECLPLPICIGQLLQIHENRPAGEIAGVFMLRGGAPCVVDAYMGTLQRFITEQRLDDVFLFCPDPDNDYCGFDSPGAAKPISSAIVLADILMEIEYVLRVVGGPTGVDRLKAEWARFLAAARSPELFHAELPGFVSRLAALPRTRDPATCPRVIVTGDMFTRFSSFFMEGVPELYAERGVILKPVDLNDFVQYYIYHGVAESACGWALKPGWLAFAKACTKIFRPEGKEYLQRWIAYQLERRSEHNLRDIFRRTELLMAGDKDVATLFEKAAEQVSPKIWGEIIPTIGDGLEAETKGYDGIIVIGPFNCLPFRISEAILKPLCVEQGMPLLTYESDGYAVSPSMLRQVDVHIQQVLDHAARKGKELEPTTTELTAR